MNGRCLPECWVWDSYLVQKLPPLVKECHLQDQAEIWVLLLHLSIHYSDEISVKMRVWNELTDLIIDQLSPISGVKSWTEDQLLLKKLNLDALNWSMYEREWLRVFVSFTHFQAQGSCSGSSQTSYWLTVQWLVDWCSGDIQCSYDSPLYVAVDKLALSHSLCNFSETHYGIRNVWAL